MSSWQYFEFYGSAQRAKQNYFVSFQIVEEVPRLVCGSCENFRRFPKVNKRKGIQNGSTNFEFKYFKTLQTSK